MDTKVNHKRLTGKIGQRSTDPLRARPLAESVFRLIWREHRISRAEIARQFGLSRSTVTEIVKVLLTSGFINEVGSGKSSGGRKPIVLEFQDETYVTIGIDIGVTHVAVALTDLRGKLISWKEEPWPVRSDPKGTRELITRLCNEALADHSLVKSQLLTIGIAVPSPVDPLQPSWLPEIVIPAWKGSVELDQILQEFDVPFHIDNDANLGALAEYWWGAGRGIEDLIYIKIAFGIGAGYILNGETYRGANGVAGEFGHIPIDSTGRKCVCGLNGCLASYVGEPALEERLQILLKDYPDSLLANRQPSLNNIEDAALQGDELAQKIVKEVADYLGIAIAGWCNLMNPQKVILGGSLTKLDNMLLGPIRDRVNSGTLVTSAADMEICMSELGSRAIATGAATYALNKEFHELAFLNI